MRTPGLLRVLCVRMSAAAWQLPLLPCSAGARTQGQQPPLPHLSCRSLCLYQGQEGSYFLLCIQDKRHSLVCWREGGWFKCAVSDWGCMCVCWMKQPASSGCTLQGTRKHTSTALCRSLSLISPCNVHMSTHPTSMPTSLVAAAQLLIWRCT